MNNRRSYLDSLNAGRQRRPYASLDDLNRSLETLEQRIGQTPEPVRQTRDTTPPRSGTPSSRPISERQYQALAHDMDRVRGQEDSIASVSKIAGELKGLREELRHQMTSGLKREFDSLRQDISRAYGAGQMTGVSSELGLELERIVNSVNALSERSDDKSVNLLRLELQQVRAALDPLAREETVRTADRRWDDFDRRWSDFEDRMEAGSGRHGNDPELIALNARLSQINDAVNNLPESLSLQSLEEKVRMLASAVEHFSHNDERGGHSAFAQIEERLDEISRAIVASSAIQPSAIDPQPFERIEARITSLARQLEELSDEKPNVEVINRLNLLSQRVDALANRAEMPEKAVERLAGQVTAIGAKLDSAPQATISNHVLQGIEQRFDALSDMLDRRQDDAVEMSQSLFRDLERRLDEVAVRLETRDASSGVDQTNIMDAIDQRFNDFARNLEARSSASSNEVIRGLEARLQDISGRLDQSAASVSGIDPELMRNLEAQVAGLSAHLSKPAAPMPEFEDIAPRLVDLEKTISGNRESLLSAARQAAEDAVRALSVSNDGSAASVGLANDVKALEVLTRRSDERNTKTFEAIHDTLLKIVDRLGSLETGPGLSSTPAASRKMAVDNAPSIETGEEMPHDAEAEDALSLSAMRGWDEPAVTRSPAEAAAAAAVAALNPDAEPIPQNGRAKRSMLGGLSRAFTRSQQAEVEPLAEAPPIDMAPSVDLDEPLDPKLANRPLEPGSGAPDLGAIMKRVRDERGQSSRGGELDAAKSDFIAAARRAAQAAAAEADMLKKNTESPSSPRRLKIGSLFGAKRKTLLLSATAIILALAGMQLSKAFLSDGGQGTLAGSDTIRSDVNLAAAPDVTSPGAENTLPISPTDGVRMIEATERSALETAAPEGSGLVSTVPLLASTASTATPASDDVVDDEPISATLPETEAIDTDANSTASTPPAAEAAAPVASAFTVPNEAGPVPLREAAEAGDPKALFEIGARYAEGRGTKANLSEAAGWYEKSAELGFAPAQYRIGNLYEKGTGVTRDVAKAKTWYQMAAAQGNASAMHNLAVLFAMGADGVADNDSAARWFSAAAELGVKDSQFNLGILAAKGVGVEQNLEASYKWFALVAKTGDRDAAAKRDEIAKSLRPEQLERARGATELWKPKPVAAETNTVEIPEAWQESAGKTASVDMKQVVKNIQRILNKNGYDAGGADGVMGAKTKSAIAKFQGDNGLPTSGAVDEKLVKLLLEKK
ncbi:peptidoglycan-binding protein [Mesorhizobium sp. NBSH29]|uniref:SEL1-like repeat protein n=1 Tax=Mesorhizobium sp. NBSH29 TaxID=2654249 RepID=UPI001896901A|nr:SEL1-like repeat protein [Mesorhizobium sp. NBSH29]QPC86715.1 peptidoglycan-binding protein [Mesorhizobium sp. NBSH29]